MMGLRVCFDLYFDDEIEIQIWNVDIIYFGLSFSWLIEFLKLRNNQRKTLNIAEL